MEKKYIALLSAFLLVFINVLCVYAQESSENDTPVLFSVVIPKSLQDSITYIHINSLQLDENDEFIVELSSSTEKLIVVKTQTSKYGSYINAKNNHIRLHLNQSEYPTGWLMINNDLKLIKWDEQNSMPFVENSTFEGLECLEEHETDVSREVIMDRLSEATPPEKQINAEQIANISPIFNDSVTIDVMVVYTGPAENWVKTCFPFTENGCTGSRDIETYIEGALALSQAALDNSKVPIKLRLVHSYKTDYDESDDGVESSGERLRRFTASPSFNPWRVGTYMTDVHKKRDLYGADMVAGFFDLNDVGGIAWREISYAGTSQYAFSLNRIQQLMNTYTLIHELGHNFGNGHSRNQTSNAASKRGGLFEFSTGYRNTFGTPDSGFTTVMGYSQGFKEIPFFSTPDVTFDNDVVIGGDNIRFGPSDAAMNNRLMMSSISAYRPTKVMSPTMISQESIVATVPANQTSTISLPISNQGSGQLMGNIFHYTDEIVANSVYESPSSKPQETLVFEGFEEFVPGLFDVRDNWRSFSNNYQFEISRNNPSAGSLHLRLSSRGDLNDEQGTTLSISSPYYGPQSPGLFTLEMDIYSNPDSTQRNDSELHIYINDSQDEISGGVVVKNRSLSTLSKNNEGSTVIQGSYNFPLRTYNRVKVVYDTEQNRVRYFINNSQIASVELLTPMPTMSHLELYYVPTNASVSYDVDNISISKSDALRWLSIPEEAFSIEPGETKDIDLEISTSELISDAYQGKLYLKTNDPSAETSVIPISLFVEASVSTEENNFADEYELLPAYPNPFNPKTTISYRLKSSTKVNLEIYNVAGRRVATLVDNIESPGKHTMQWDATSMSSGLYFIKFQAGDFLKYQAITLLK